ncbi:MAG: YgjV family protein, partial [Clostridia bacterium]|nr:YgjV family protein [Clostridia bacterium]
MYEFIAQAIGVVAMAFNILSFQNKNQKNVIAFQFFGGLLFSVSFFMLGAMSGCLLNLIAVIRAVVFVNKQKLNAERPLWLAAFALAFITSY